MAAGAAPGQRVTAMATPSLPGGSYRALLALSFAPDLAAPARAALERRARRALSLLCDGAPARHDVADASLLLLAAGDAGPGLAAPDGSFAYSVGVGGTDWRRQRACDGSSLLAAVRRVGAAALADLAPPFAVLFRARPDGPLEAATDACGILHVYVTAGSGFAACSSSCLALGALGDGRLDLESIAMYARLGFYPSARAPLSGVRRLRPGEACALADGALRVTTWAQAPPREPPFPSFAAAVDGGAAALRDAVGTLAAAHPRIGLSLSGGLDSRVVLAALPPERRAALEVLCLSAPGRDEAPLVRRLAHRCGFAPTIVDVAAFPTARAIEWAEGASRRRAYCANPLSVAVLDWAESIGPTGPRLHGQNGELARGFYGGLDPAPAAVTPASVAALLRTRRMSGGQVAPWLLASAYREPVAAALADELHAWLSATGLPWAEATDELYLAQRMAGWVGVELSRTSTRRIDLSPFFDPRVLAFARRAAPAHKRESRLLGAMLAALDPTLAGLPLYAPAPPTAPPSTPAPSVFAAPVGAAAVRAQLLADAATAGLSLARAAALPLFDPTALAGALRPDSPLDVTALGFVLSVEWMLAFLERARATPDA